MREKIFLFSMVFMILGLTSFSFAKEEYTDLKDPKNNISKHDELKVGRTYLLLKSNTEDFNGMDYDVYKLECLGEDFLEKDGTIKYAQKGNGSFVQHKDGKYSSVEHKGMTRENYSKLQVGWKFTCNHSYTYWDEDLEEEVEVFCDKYGTTWTETRYKAYTKEVFEGSIKNYYDPSWCEHAAASYNLFVSQYEKEKIRNSQSSKVEYYVYGGMPVGIPIFTLLTSIAPNTDLWVDIYSPDSKKGLYNAGVYQLFDSTSPHIKHTASSMSEEENKLLHTKQVFTDVESKSLGGLMYYPNKIISGDTRQYFIVCNECSTCERCETERYDKLNTYVAYGEIPKFYLSRGCQIHSCCFVYDYPVVLPDTFEGVKCPDLKKEGDKYPACEAHTCKRWLEHSDYREAFAPQTCLKVVAGVIMAGTEAGIKEVRYNGPVDEGLIQFNGRLTIIDGGYSEYCANHMCNAFFCENPRENSESYSSKYDKNKNAVTMPNKFCSAHKLGCKVVCNYNNQPKEKVATVGETIIEQIKKDKLENKFNFCEETVTQSYYAFRQTNTLICEDCYKLMGNKQLNSSSSKKSLDITSKCMGCGSSGVSVFDTLDGKKRCAPCIDFKKYGVIHRNINNYDYTDVKGVEEEGKCIFNIQRFAGDNPSLCGERCVDKTKYCDWHLCDTEKCKNPVKYVGTYFCKTCCPDPKDSGQVTMQPMIDPTVPPTPPADSGVINDINGSITSEELLEMLRRGEGARFTFKGKVFELTNYQLLCMLNVINNECSTNIPQATAIGQVFLNAMSTYGFDATMGTAFMGYYYANTGGTYDLSANLDYNSNTLNAVANILSNSSISQEVANVINNSCHYAGYSDEVLDNNLVEAMESYVESGHAYTVEGTILDSNDTYIHTVFSEVFPGVCTKCRKFLHRDGRCFDCDM